MNVPFRAFILGLIVISSSARADFLKLESSTYLQGRGAMLISGGVAFNLPLFSMFQMDWGLEPGLFAMKTEEGKFALSFNLSFGPTISLDDTFSIQPLAGLSILPLPAESGSSVFKTMELVVGIDNWIKEEVLIGDGIVVGYRYWFAKDDIHQINLGWIFEI